MKSVSKRTKISFEIINKGRYQIIPPEKIADSNSRIKKAMSDFIKKMKRK